MQVISKWIGNLDFEGVNTREHKLTMSSSDGNLGPTPMEMVLMGLGGCTGMDVASILAKMRVDFDRFEVVVTGSRGDEHPRVFNRVSVVYRIWGDEISEDKFKKAVDLTQEKYCSVLHMVNKTAEVNYSYEINPIE